MRGAGPAGAGDAWGGSGVGVGREWSKTALWGVGVCCDVPTLGLGSSEKNILTRFKVWACS